MREREQNIMLFINLCFSFDVWDEKKEATELKCQFARKTKRKEASRFLDAMSHEEKVSINRLVRRRNRESLRT